MCGIVGVISSNRSLIDQKTHIARMMNEISYRGPDGEGTHYIENQAYFGHKRLAVIDINHGKQPMVSQDSRYSLVFNGEIYNYLELREYLQKKGVAIQTSSDTEVLLSLLIYEGFDALEKLNGMFAFIFHDKEKNKWIAARDPFGIKPLYYTLTKDLLLFASEIKSLLVHPDVEVSRDNSALYEYIAFQFCLGEKTLFSDIFKLMPGYVFSGIGNKIKSQTRYWNNNYNIDRSITEKHYLKKLNELLFDSLKIQTRSDVPVGGYLSGGLDSSLVCTLAAKNLPNKMPVFHGRFLEGEMYDESYYAKTAAKGFDGIYYEYTPSSSEFIEYLPKLIYFLDEPLAGPGLFPQYMVSRLAKKHVTVVLGGQGGDEIFGGYTRYLVGYLEQALKGAIFETNEEGKHLVSLDSILPNLPELKRYIPLIKHFWSRGLFDNMDSRYFHLIDRSQGLEDLLHPAIINDLNKERLFSSFKTIFNHPNTKSYINKMTYFDQKTLLPALLQVEDRVSMAVSLESRVPLLDKRIVNLVSKMPPGLKFQGGKSKYILKKSTQSIVPDAIHTRKDKMGFPVPLVEWMKKRDVKEFVSDTLLSSNSIQRNIYDKNALENIINNPGVGARKLWGALCLELWHLNFIDG